MVLRCTIYHMCTLVKLDSKYFFFLKPLECNCHNLRTPPSTLDQLGFRNTRHYITDSSPRGYANRVLPIKFPGCDATFDSG